MNTNLQPLYFVTSNEFKYQLYTVLLGMPNLEWLPMKVQETRETNITDVASGKVAYVQHHAGSIQFPCFLEQSGLVIKAWKGFPGGLSRVFIDQFGDELLCKMLRSFDNEERRAHIQTIIYYLQDETTPPKSFGGMIHGIVVKEPLGGPCFGWDRIFIPDGFHETFAQMDFNKTIEILANTKHIQNFRRFLEPKFSQVGTYDKIGLHNGISTSLSLGLSPALLKRLRTILTNCDWFSDNARLKTLFIDQRIAEWKDSLPEADNSTVRVTSTLNYLHSSRNHRSENGLVLFLYVLADNIDSSNALHRELIDLATELEKDLQDRC